MEELEQPDHIGSKRDLNMERLPKINPVSFRTSKTGIPHLKPKPAAPPHSPSMNAGVLCIGSIAIMQPLNIFRSVDFYFRQIFSEWPLIEMSLNMVY